MWVVSGPGWMATKRVNWIKPMLFVCIILRIIVLSWRLVTANSQLSAARKLPLLNCTLPGSSSHLFCSIALIYSRVSFKLPFFDAMYQHAEPVFIRPCSPWLLINLMCKSLVPQKLNHGWRVDGLTGQQAIVRTVALTDSQWNSWIDAGDILAFEIRWQGFVIPWRAPRVISTQDLPSFTHFYYLLPANWQVWFDVCSNDTFQVTRWNYYKLHLSTLLSLFPLTWFFMRAFMEVFLAFLALSPLTLPNG